MKTKMTKAQWKQFADDIIWIVIYGLIFVWILSSVLYGFQHGGTGLS